MRRTSSPPWRCVDRAGSRLAFRRGAATRWFRSATPRTALAPATPRVATSLSGGWTPRARGTCATTTRWSTSSQPWTCARTWRWRGRATWAGCCASTLRAVSTRATARRTASSTSTEARSPSSGRSTRRGTRSLTATATGMGSTSRWGVERSTWIGPHRGRAEAPPPHRQTGLSIVAAVTPTTPTPTTATPRTPLAGRMRRAPPCARPPPCAGCPCEPRRPPSRRGP
mmetsp:Transcript_17603/g.61937  ORF Transcript_17603/g.61937 Transcript_17603/m.61937 type:complete len:227 (-) Transcript_17603:431-1111(-)